MIYRSALIGLLLGLVIAVGLLLMPENRNLFRRGQMPSDLPPALFPAFPPEEGKQGRMRLPTEPFLKFERTPMKKELAPGGNVRFTISVKNVSDLTLKNLTIEERYDESLLMLQKAEEGIRSENKITWKIPALDPNERFTASYTVQVISSLSPQALEVTAFVRGEQVEESLSASRMATSVLKIIPMPNTGVDLR